MGKDRRTGAFPNVEGDSNACTDLAIVEALASTAVDVDIGLASTPWSTRMGDGPTPVFIVDGEASMYTDKTSGLASTV